jgi:hypothetical protein
MSVADTRLSISDSRGLNRSGREKDSSAVGVILIGPTEAGTA